MKASQMFAHWKQVHADSLATLAKFSDAELAFTPFPGSWPAGKIALHIFDTEDYWLRYVARGEGTEPPDAELKDYPTVAAITEFSNQVHTGTESYLESLDLSDLERSLALPGSRSTSLGWIIWHVLEHEIHHRGELSLILGILGREGLDV